MHTGVDSTFVTIYRIDRSTDERSTQKFWWRACASAHHTDSRGLCACHHPSVDRSIQFGYTYLRIYYVKQPVWCPHSCEGLWFDTVWNCTTQNLWWCACASVHHTETFRNVCLSDQNSCRHILEQVSTAPLALTTLKHLETLVCQHRSILSGFPLPLLSPWLHTCTGGDRTFGIP